MLCTFWSFRTTKYVSWLSLGVGYFFLAALGIYVTREAGNIAAIWPANGLLLSFLMFAERRDWPGLMAVCVPGLVAANLIFGDTLPVALGLVVANIVEVFVAAYLFAKYDDTADPLSDLVSILRFVAYCVCVAPVFGAILGAGVLHVGYGADYFSVLPVWWAADALGYLLILPLVAKGAIAKGRLVELCFLVLCSSAVLGYGFTSEKIAVLFPILPLMLLSAFRVGPPGTALLGLIVSTICIGFTVHDRAVLVPIAGGEVVHQIIFIQFYLVTAVFAPFVISVVWAERARMIRSLQANEAALEDMAVRSETLREEAEQASRFKSLFIAQVSHEFRTPLNAIKGFSEMLKNEFFGPLGSDKYREYVDLITWSGDHLLQVVDDVMVYSQIETGRYQLNCEDTDIAPIVDDVCKFFAVKARSDGLEVKTSIAENMPAIDADPKALRIMLLNLVGNAGKFTPTDGRVTVTAVTNDEAVRITVSDTGPGIPQKDIDRILGPFQRGAPVTQKAEEGAGLGLSIVYGLVRLHGGSLEIENSPEGGAVFTLVLLV